MARQNRADRPSHRCGECGLTVAKWLGQCPECQAWGSITEVGATRVALVAGTVSAPARRIDEVEVEAALSRPTGISELDRVLGGGLVPGAVVLLAGEPGAGKALALDTPLPTPSGWTTMGAVAVGDQVLGVNGRPTDVIAATDVLIGRPCFEVEFSDGSVIVADKEHQWATRSRRDRLSAYAARSRTTFELAASLRVESGRRLNHSVDVAAPLDLPEVELPIPPYTLGAWLADGSSDGGCLTSADREILLAIEAEGVLGDKHIPDLYLRASESQRRELLAGLLDTGGSCSTSGCVTVGFASERLADDAHELVVSLGYKASRRSKPVQGRSPDRSLFHQISFSTPDKVFRLTRKLERLTGGRRATQARRYITDVRPVASVPVRCIQVAAEDRLFLAGTSMIPTHNSTLSLAMAAQMASTGSRVLYVTGEESAAQVRLRAGRTGALTPSLWLAAETELGAVLAHLDAVKPDLLVLDSVQTVASAQAEGGAGGVTQVRTVAAALTGAAKERNIATVLVGHVTKDGSIAGPRLLEHLVDVVLHFEGDRGSSLRMVRAVKNRFGPADEVGCFALGDDGITGLTDPSGLFLSRRTDTVPGTCVTVTIEGRRPLLAEVQALVGDDRTPSPRRAVSGLDSSRVAMVLAVVDRRAGVKLAMRDVYTATVGGVRLSEPACDLAVALAVFSANSDLPLPGGLVAIGEVGLSGELRPVSGVERRLAEASRLGFSRALVPLGSSAKVDGIRVREVADLGQALRTVVELAKRPPLRPI
jgi:DNA repair protein RadA/Sms